jgi:hypothetical protein
MFNGLLLDKQCRFFNMPWYSPEAQKLFGVLSAFVKKWPVQEN